MKHVDVKRIQKWANKNFILNKNNENVFFYKGSELKSFGIFFSIKIYWNAYFII